MSEINYFDQNPNQEVEDDFKDQPDEIEGQPTPDGGWQAKSAPPVEGPAISTRPQRPTTPTVKLPPVQIEEEQTEEEAEEAEDFSNILVDARLRLEQGRLYELIMNHDIFNGADADPKAVKFVQKQIRTFAKEQMEIMLGMRKETSTVERLEIDFPFNALEVDTLKALARAATKGASEHSDRYVPEITRTTEEVENVPRKTTLNPIGGSRRSAPAPVKKAQGKPLASKPAAPVQRQKVDSAVQRILEEEGVTLEEINQVFDPRKKYLSPEELAQLTPEQIVERNKAISVRNKTVSNPNAVPMPSPEQIEAMVVQRANQAAANPQMKTIMGLLDEAAKRKG